MPWQEDLRCTNLSKSKKATRSWHAAHVQQMCGNTHMAKALMKVGVRGLHVMAELMKEDFTSLFLDERKFEYGACQSVLQFYSGKNYKF